MWDLVFNTVIWAMITDVIDDAEVKNGVREDGTIYLSTRLRESWVRRCPPA